MNRPSSFAWRPKTTVFLLGGFALILIAVIVAFAVSNFKPTTRVSINASLYDVQLADTDAERTQGLSGVESLSPNGGLLMQFDTNHEWGIWMKDMLIPLDIIWLDETKNVVYIKENVSPELGTDVVMQPKKPSRYVLELPAGSVQKAAIKVGQQANFTIEGENK
jgi:uncharacterized protein